jgi:hypothetical protein
MHASPHGLDTSCPRGRDDEFAVDELAIRGALFRETAVTKITQV